MANIIDGIDVSECEHLFNEDGAKGLYLCRINFDGNYFSNGIPLAGKCKKHQDCYYKQLKRAEKENSLLRNKLNFVEGELNQIKLLNEGQNTRVITLNEELQTLMKYVKEDLQPHAKIYKQALMDIKEIVSEQIDNTDKDDESMCLYGTIYNKINEVIGVEENG